MINTTPDPSSVTPHCARRFALALGVILFCLYAATGSKLRFGYEGQSIDQAEALLLGKTAPRPAGGILPFTQGGVMDVAAYVPFSALKLALDRSGHLWGLRQLIYPFVIPFYTTILLLLFFYLALELYRNARTAALLTLILGLATMVWPYAKYGMETQQTLWTLAGLLALARWQRRPGVAPAVWLGVALAALMLTKITGPLNAAALFAAFVFEGFKKTERTEGTERTMHIAVAGVMGAMGVAAFLLTNRWRYGGWLFGGRYGIGHETAPYPFFDGIWAALVSPGKSIFIFSPALLLGLWFWGAFWRRFTGMRLVVVLFVLIGIWQLHNRPWADETWGPRRLHYLVPVLALPLGLWLEGRAGLRRWVRALGAAAIAAGIAVQLIAVSVDYTAFEKTLGKTEQFALENTVWQPQLSPIGFDLHLLHSAWHRARTGGELPFVYELHYMPWSAPASPPAPRIFPLNGRDSLDFWVVQQRQDWPGRAYWFRAGSFYLWLMLLAAALGGGFWLWKYVDCGTRDAA